LVFVVGKSGKQSSSWSTFPLGFDDDDDILTLLSELTFIDPNNSSSSWAADFVSLILLEASISIKFIRYQK
jgi:hypothetical protein